MMPPPGDGPPMDGTPLQTKDERSIPEWVTGTYRLPHYHDRTPFPENFLEHETVMGYSTDRPPSNEGADEILEVVSLFEHEGLRCCIIEVMALVYYGSQRMQNVCFLQSERRHGLLTAPS